MLEKQRLYQHKINYKYNRINGNIRMFFLWSVEKCGKNTHLNIKVYS